MKKSKIIASLIINIMIFVCTLVTMIYYIFFGGEGNMEVQGLQTLRFFTNLSNIYCAFISLALAIYEIHMLITGKTEIPHPLMVLKNTGASAVGLTFFTVLLILIPLSGKFSMFYAGMIFMPHCSTPILAMISYMFPESGEKTVSWKECFFSVIPTFLYALIYELEVVILENWPDYYGFTMMGGKVAAFFIVMPILCALTYLISFLLAFGQEKMSNKKQV